MDLMLLAAAILIAGTTFSVALAVQTSLGGSRYEVARRISEPATPPQSALTLLIPTLRPVTASSKRLRLELDRAGIALTVKQYLFLRFALGIAGGLTLTWLAGRAEFGGIVGILAGLAGFVLGYQLPAMHIKGRIASRLDVIEDQVLEALVSITKSLKSGLGLIQALEFAAREGSEPLGPELARIVSELQMGADAEAAFEEMNQRLGSADFEIATTAILIQRRVGGNLSEILTSVSNTIRERRTMRSEVRVMTARQRLTGNVSALLPVLVALFFFAVNPDVANLLLSTTTGRISLVVGILFELMGLWLIRRFAVVEV